MGAVSDLLPRVRLYAPGASDPLLQDQLENAAVEFCHDTWICYEDVTGISDSDGSVVFSSPNGNEVIAVLRLPSNGRTIWQRWPDYIDATLGYTDLSTLSADQPLSFVTEGDTLTVRMVPIATATQVMGARLVVAPVVGEDSAPDQLTGKWADAVAAKALERTLLMPNQTFTSPALSKEFERRYNEDRQRARVEVNRALSRHGARVSGPRFIGR